MDEKKTQKQAVLGTLVNEDASGIIAYSDQIYDKKEEKSVENIGADHEKRVKQLETWDEQLQDTIENITKTGEASAASNVTYNHNDSQLNASNVQQAIDEVYSKGNSNVENTREELNQSLQDVYKKSNPNDEDGNIIDTNTIESVQDNPEFVEAKTDSDDKLLESTDVKGKKTFYSDAEVKGKFTHDGVLHYSEDNPEFLCVLTDSEDKLIVGIDKETGSPRYGVGVPTQIKEYIDEKVNSIFGSNDTTDAIDTLNEVKNFLTGFTNKDTLKALLNDIYKRSNPNDEEGNIIDTNSIVSVEDNPEYIKAITDSVGKLIEAIGLDGVRKFFAGIDIQGVKQCVIDNPEYIAAWLDYNDRIILAIENDGNLYFGYGIPNQIQSVLDAINTSLTSALEDIEKKINLGNDTYPSDVHEIAENPEYISVVLDAAQKILEAYGVDGIKRLFTALEVMGTRMSMEENPEYIKVDVDKDDKILGGFKTDGDYVFGAGVPTQIQEKTKEIADNLDTANAIELGSDSDGNVYATTGVDGNIEVTSDDTGTVYMTYDTDKVSIEDAYEDEEGNLIVEQNKVITL